MMNKGQRDAIAKSWRSLQKINKRLGKNFGGSAPWSNEFPADVSVHLLQDEVTRLADKLAALLQAAIREDLMTALEETNERKD